MLMMMIIIINDDDEISETDSKQESRKQKKKVKLDINLTNIELVYLSPNTTTHFQLWILALFIVLKLNINKNFVDIWCTNLILE